MAFNVVPAAVSVLSFAIMQPPAGTSPTAASATDTLTFTSSDSTVTITGDSVAKTLDFKVGPTPPGDITLTNGHILVGNSSNVAANVAMSGDITIVSSGTTTIASNAVTNAKAAQMAANTIKGNNTAGLANASDLTVSQVNTLLGCVTTVGAIDSQSTSANGIVISGNSIYMQSASATVPGTVSLGAQIFAGDKQFSGNTYLAYNTVGSIATIGNPSSTAVHVYNGGMQLHARTVAASFSLDSGSTDNIVYMTTSGGAYTVTLPVPVNGRTFTIADGSGNAATNNITIARHGSETIGGVAGSYVINVNYGAVTLISDGTNWTIKSTTLPNAANLIGTVAIAHGGTNSTASLNNNRVMQSSGGAIIEAAAITASRALISDANGIPTQSVTTSTELTYVNGVTSQLSGNTQVATLQGKTLNGLTTNLNTTAKTGNYTLTTTDVVAQGDASGGAFTFTLPTAVGVAGQIYTLQKIVSDTSFNAITIATTSAQTINGAASDKLQTFGETLVVQSNGSNWIIINRFFPSTWTSYTPTWTSGGTAPALGNGTIGGMWMRAPGGVYIRISLESGSTTTFGNNSNGWTFSTPSNMPNIDLTKLPTPQTEMQLGFAMATVYTGSYFGWSGQVRYQSGTTVKIQNNAGQGLSDFDSAHPGTWSASGACRLYLDFFAPITGWN